MVFNDTVFYLTNIDDPFLPAHLTFKTPTRNEQPTRYI